MGTFACDRRRLVLVVPERDRRVLRHTAVLDHPAHSGFFFGLAIGAQGVQALFGDGFLSTTFSWIVAFFLGLLFALLSYLFWYVAVALVGGIWGTASWSDSSG
jgi:hypothetical protein